MFLIDDLLIIGGSALLGGLIGGAAGAAIGFIIDVFLDESSIGSEVKVRYPDALKILIQEKKKTAVNVGIFGDNGTVIESNVEIESSQGVSDNLYVGQQIYLYA